MSGVVIHFGVDSSYRLPLLENAGFEVVDCGTSLPDLSRAISQHEVCAVAITQTSSHELPPISELRSHKSVPVILFASISAPDKAADVDLVIPLLTPPSSWLAQIAELLKKSREIAEESASIRRQSVGVRRQSVAPRARSASERERSTNARAKAHRNANEPKKHSNLS